MEIGREIQQHSIPANIASVKGGRIHLNVASPVNSIEYEGGWGVFGMEHSHIPNTFHILGSNKALPALSIFYECCVRISSVDGKHYMIKVSLRPYSPQIVTARSDSILASIK